MAERDTLLITRRDVEAVLSMADAVAAVEDAFRAHGLGETRMPPKTYVQLPSGDLRCMPAYLPYLGVAGAKLVTVHPENRGLPVVNATLTLIDPDCGFPLAIMDATHITALRTGAAGGVAVKYLARPDADTLAFVGAGVQAKAQLAAIIHVRPGIGGVRIYDTNPRKAEAFAAWVGEEFGLESQVCSSAAQAAQGADVITTTTPSRAPVLLQADIAPGTHINAIGADAAGKQELDPAILQNALVVIDDWEQASHSGEINKAVADGILSRATIHATLGEVVAGKTTGRTNDADVTVFDSTGLAVQDIACAAVVYRRMTEPRPGHPQAETLSLL